MGHAGDVQFPCTGSASARIWRRAGDTRRRDGRVRTTFSEGFLSMLRGRGGRSYPSAVGARGVSERSCSVRYSPDVVDVQPHPTPHQAVQQIRPRASAAPRSAGRVWMSRRVHVSSTAMGLPENSRMRESWVTARFSSSCAHQAGTSETPRTASAPQVGEMTKG